MRRASLPILWCLAAAALFGASTPAVKMIIGEIHPVTLAGLLYLGAAIAVLPFSRKGGSARLRSQPAQIKKLAGAVFFGGVLGPVLLMFGLAIAPAASVSLWLNFETVATAVIAWAFFREHLDGKTWSAAALIFAAGIVLAFPFGGVDISAAVLVVLACVCWGLDNNLTSIIDGYTPSQITLTKGLVAGVLNLAIGIVLGGLPGNYLSLLAGILIGTAGYGLSIVLYITGTQQLGAARSQIIFSSAPFIGVVASWLVLHERVLTTQIIAGLIMAGGISLLFAAKHRHVHLHGTCDHTHAHSHDDGHHAHEHMDADRELLPCSLHVHAHKHDSYEHEHEHVSDIHHRHGHSQ
jgi:drug/metabolite transporter (DMT)-like permease